MKKKIFELAEEELCCGNDRRQPSLSMVCCFLRVLCVLIYIIGSKSLSFGGLNRSQLMSDVAESADF